MPCRVFPTTKLRVGVSEEKPVAARASEIAVGRQTMVATAGDQSDEDRQPEALVSGVPRSEHRR